MTPDVVSVTGTGIEPVYADTTFLQEASAVDRHRSIRDAVSRMEPLLRDRRSSPELLGRAISLALGEFDCDLSDPREARAVILGLYQTLLDNTEGVRFRSERISTAVTPPRQVRSQFKRAYTDLFEHLGDPASDAISVSSELLRTFLYDVQPFEECSREVGLVLAAALLIRDGLKFPELESEWLDEAAHPSEGGRGKDTARRMYRTLLAGLRNPVPINIETVALGEMQARADGYPDELRLRTLGFEVFDAQLEKACCGLGNIDPQHREFRSDISAAQRTLTWPLEELGSHWEHVFLTPILDLDSAAAMAIIFRRMHGKEISPEMLQRIQRLSLHDLHDYGKWEGPYTGVDKDGRLIELPAKNSPWPDFFRFEDRELQALAEMLRDDKIEPQSKVALMDRWLERGILPQRYIQDPKRLRTVLHDMHRQDRLEISALPGKEIAHVQCLKRFPSGANAYALSAGYLVAPVVVDERSTPDKKTLFRIGLFGAEQGDLREVKRILEERGAETGGSPRILIVKPGTAKREQVFEALQEGLSLAQGG
ncbi:MAG: hypothetical protein KDD53_07345 [Bdellovibrionales bacterium]|nr:hypothetical protein [Bdellovibrionales bacterium]